MLTYLVSRGVFLFKPKFQKFWLESKLNGPFLFSLAGIFDAFEGGPLWTVLLVWPKWPFQNEIIVVPVTAHLYPAYKHLLKHTVAWVWGLYNWNVLVYHWVYGISKISNKNFCWMERTIKLDVVGVHLLCLGLTRSFNKNNLKNIPLHVKELYCVFVVHKVAPKVQRIQGCYLEACAGDFLWLPSTLLAVIFIGKIEPKEIPSCLIPCLLVVRIQQLEILVTALLTTAFFIFII